MTEMLADRRRSPLGSRSTPCCGGGLPSGQHSRRSPAHRRAAASTKRHCTKHQSARLEKQVTRLVAAAAAVALLQMQMACARAAFQASLCAAASKQGSAGLQRRAGDSKGFVLPSVRVLSQIK